MTKKILIACEWSQTVTIEFRKLGFEAYSCDVIECSGDHPEWHIQRNVLEILDNGWDLMIAHPPCTYLTNAGVRHLSETVCSKNGIKAKIHGKARFKGMEKACEFFNKLFNANIPKICIENPIPHKYARAIIGNYTQLIQPWQFGHMESKSTCLWLKNLPKLVPAKIVKEEMLVLPKKERNKIHFMSLSKDRAKLRSKTYIGISKAIASQWGNL